MNDFRSYQKNAKRGEQKGAKNERREKSQEDSMRETIEEFQSKSEGELWEELLARYAMGVQNGSMDFQKLSSFADQVRPFLSAEQKTRLNSVLSRLKEQ